MALTKCPNCTNETMVNSIFGSICCHCFFDPAKDGEPPIGTFTCPDCGMISCNVNDVRERYCGNCHEFKETLQNK